MKGLRRNDDAMKNKCWYQKKLIIDNGELKISEDKSKITNRKSQIVIRKSLRIFKLAN